MAQDSADGTAFALEFGGKIFWNWNKAKLVPLATVKGDVDTMGDKLDHIKPKAGQSVIGEYHTHCAGGDSLAGTFSPNDLMRFIIGFPKRTGRVSIVEAGEETYALVVIDEKKIRDMQTKDTIGWLKFLGANGLRGMNSRNRVQKLERTLLSMLALTDGGAAFYKGRREDGTKNQLQRIYPK